MTPLDPSGPHGRSLLREELLKPEYVRPGVVQRILDWIDRLLSRTGHAAGQVSWLTTLAAIVVVVGLLVAILLLVSRGRRTARTAATARAVLDDPSLGAAELRGRAERHLAAERYDEALVDAYRALARRRIERGAIDDIPQATAHEIARALEATVRADLAAEVARAADLFDAVLYGAHPATRDQAVAVLGLDETLDGRRVGAR